MTRLRVTNDVPAGDLLPRPDTRELPPLTRALLAVVAMAAVIAGVLALHSLAGGHSLTHSIVSVAAPHHAEVADSASSPVMALPSDETGLSCGIGCAEDCAVLAASCGLLFVLAAVLLLPAPADAMIRAMKAWLGLLRQRGRRLLRGFPAPSLLQLSISRV